MAECGGAHQHSAVGARPAAGNHFRLVSRRQSQPEFLTRRTFDSFCPARAEFVSVFCFRTALRNRGAGRSAGRRFRDAQHGVTAKGRDLARRAAVPESLLRKGAGLLLRWHDGRDYRCACQGCRFARRRAHLGL